METVLRSGDSTIEDLILNLVSLDYNELLMAAAGTSADAALTSANQSDHILVVNGSIPMADNGIYTTIAGRTAEQILRESAQHATAIFAVGACAHWGSVQASHPNPTGAVGVDQVITDKPVINVAGCPPIGEVITASLVHTLSLGAPPPTDSQGRPLFAYGERIHDFCPRRARFDARPSSAKGVGFAEVARGTLSHWVRIQDAAVANYQARPCNGWSMSGTSCGTP
jgi:hydrogenase small subunit